MSAADSLVGYEFDTEDGVGRVTADPAPTNEQYVVVVVDRLTLEGRYSTVRLRSMVAAHRAWKESDGAS